MVNSALLVAAASVCLLAAAAHARCKHGAILPECLDPNPNSLLQAPNTLALTLSSSNHYLSLPYLVLMYSGAAIIDGAKPRCGGGERDCAAHAVQRYRRRQLAPQGQLVPQQPL